MAISSRASVFAIKKEVTEGTPVSPAAATDFVALQDDFSFSPAFETIENPELAGGIGATAPIVGSENPTASFSHTFRHSGVEGQEADFGELLEGLLGTKTVNATEYPTTSLGSTSVANVASGPNFYVGQALLIKDGTNGYNIRNIASISTNALNLAFRVPVAVPTAVNLGKAVTYIPANSHPSYTLWEYEGNGGLVQMISGARVESMALTADPTALLNAQYAFQGVAYHFDPIVISATNKYLDFNDGGVQVVTLDEQVYKSPHAFAAALEAKLDVFGTYTVSYSNTTGKFTLTKSAGTFELLWSTGANAANSVGATLGFVVASDDTGALTYTSDNALTLTAPYTPNYDDANALVGKNGEVYMGSLTDNVCFGARNFTMDITNTIANIPDICEESGVAGKQTTGRAVTIEVVATASQYDAGKFDKFVNSTTVQFMFNCGEKSGGNWVAGKCVNVFIPTAKISAFTVDKVDDLTVFNMTLTAFMQDGASEVYINKV